MLLAAHTTAPSSAPVEPASPLDKLAGRWVGEGFLGIKDGKSESVKCRVTYIPAESTHQLKQTVRCASASGSIEVQSTIVHSGGIISGSWSELTRNMRGDLSGKVTPRGFQVMVTGADLSANMNVVINGPRQIIEIQFNNSSLIGLTLVLTKADQPMR
ncbi:MAG: hypothetical protein HC868_18055 [Sphingomonadales bacterium]|nr:hypothetical protein [Sphingomonadales bacterium]